MTQIVVDSSVAVKWLVNESDSALAERLLAENIMLAAPDLLMVEVANILWKKVLKKDIAQEIVLVSLSHAENLIHQWRDSRPLLGEATKLALELSHPVYDCVYLVLAQSLNVPVVTADKRLLARAPTGSVIALNDWRTERV